MSRRTARRDVLAARSSRHGSDVDPDDLDPVDGVEWDDVTDLVCAAGGGLDVAIALAAQDAGLDVLVAEVSPAGMTDADTAEYLRAVTEDFTPWPDAESELPSRVLDEPLPATPPRGRLETFFGVALKDWGVSCVGSPYGLLYTCVTDRVLSPSYGTADGPVEVTVLGSVDIDPQRPAESVQRWMSTLEHDRAGDLSDAGTLQRLVFDNGKVVGVAVESAGEPRLIRARHGVMISIGSGVTTVGDLTPSETAEVALVSRAASRFARLELLTRS